MVDHYWGRLLLFGCWRGLFHNDGSFFFDWLGGLLDSRYDILFYLLDGWNRLLLGLLNDCGLMLDVVCKEQIESY